MTIAVPVPQNYGPRQVFQWSGPDEQLHTVEVVGTADIDDFGTGHVNVTARTDPAGTEIHLDLDVTNARLVRDAVVAAIDWVCDNAGSNS